MSTTSEVTASVESVQVGDRTRTMTVVRHQQPGSDPVPVVLVFHGSMQTGKVIRSFTANTFDRIGAPSGAIVAYLDGYKRHWNDARIVNTSAARTDNVDDDVAFTTAAIDLLARRFNGDKSRVYAIGFSNGGQLVMRLIHEIPSALAGAAILSATQSVLENFAPNQPKDQPLPVMFVQAPRTQSPLMRAGWPRCFGCCPADSGCPHRTRPPFMRVATASPLRPPPRHWHQPRQAERKWIAPTTGSRTACRSPCTPCTGADTRSLGPKALLLAFSWAEPTTHSTPRKQSANSSGSPTRPTGADSRRQTSSTVDSSRPAGAKRLARSERAGPGAHA
jgi:dienelactone hydrolase